MKRLYEDLRREIEQELNDEEIDELDDDLDEDTEEFEDEEDFEDEDEEESDDEESEDEDSEEDEEEDDEDDFEEDDDEDDDQEELPVRRLKSSKKTGSGGSVKKALKSLGIMQGAITLTGVVILIVLVILGIRYASLNRQKSNHNTVDTTVSASASENLLAIETLGADGIAAVEKAASEALQKRIEEEERQAQLDAEAEAAEQALASAVKATINYTSIEKDLKIKFINSKSNKLIASAKFTISLVSPSGKTLTYVDDDMDGIIYKNGMEPGTYTLTVEEMDGFSFAKAEYKVVVKDTIEYVKVDVSDEVKSEDEINSKVDDTAAEIEDVTILKDTVAWVEPNKIAIANSDGYAAVDKTKLVDPATLSTVAKAGGSLGYYLMAALTDNYVSKVEITGAGNVTSGNAALEKDGTLQLTASQTKVSTDGSLEPTVTWSSDNVAAATVDNTGLVKALEVTADTNVTITATSSGPAMDDADSAAVAALTATFVITVKAPTPTPVTVSTIVLDKDKDTLAVGTNATYVATVTMSDTTKVTSATAGIVTWTSSDTKVATVDNATGKVTPVKAGTVTITATTVGKNASEQQISTTCTVTVTNSALTVIMDEKLKAYIGTTTFIPAKVTVNGVLVTTDGTANTKGHVTWTSSNTTVATIDANTGLITPLAAGTTIITATSVEKDAAGTVITDTCTVTVVKDPKLDTVTPLKTSDGAQVYVYKNNAYVAAVSADYYTQTKFYIAAATQYMYTGWQTFGDKTYYYDSTGKYVTGTQVILGAQYTFGSDGVLNLGNAILGIDVSSWNGNIDWTKVKASGVNYVIIRAGFRGSSSGALVEDKYFKTNIQGAVNAGLKVGVYFFSQAITEAEAVEEASMVLGMIKNYKISYPIFIDTEPSGGRADSLTATSRTAICKAFCNTIKNAGYTAGVYASKSYFTKKLNVSSLSDFKIWVAQYNATCTYTGRYDLWQFSDKGSINGISGNVDLNYSYLGY